MKKILAYGLFCFTEARNRKHLDEARSFGAVFFVDVLDFTRFFNWFKLLSIACPGQ